MKNVRILGMLYLIVLTGAGCQTESSKPEASTIAWQTVSEGIERIEVPLSDATTTHLVAYAFDTDQFSFDFVYSTSSRTVASWMMEYPKAAALLNGVYFNEDNTPTGDLIDGGVRTTNRQFDLDKSAYLVLAPVFGFSDVTSTARVEAGQSYPVLVHDGVATVQTDSGKMARRTFAGIRSDGKAVFGVLDTGEASLYALSQELARSEINLKTALNLDGGPSTGMMVREPEESMNSIFPVPVVIVIYRK